MFQVFQVFELPVETEKLETHQLLLLTKRELFLQAVLNSSTSPEENFTAYQAELSDALTEYEEVCSEAQDAGVNIVTKGFTNNWDYIQSCFFALTILTTIGRGTEQIVI